MNLKTKIDSEISVQEHDPCIAIRAVPVVEGLALCLLDLICREGGDSREQEYKFGQE